MDYEAFVSERIASLRTQKNISARDMSLSLGQADNYINAIENRKSLPSMSLFLYICEYFGITPKEFFDDNLIYPARLNELVAEASRLDEQALIHLLGVMKEMRDGKKGATRPE